MKKQTKKVAKRSKARPFHIIRTYSAGVFAGNIKSRSSDGKRIVIENAIRIWYWEGAFTLSALAQVGTTKPDKCKFATPVSEIEVMEAIEVLLCSAAAEKSIKGVITWQP